MLQTAALNAEFDPMQESKHDGVMISALAALVQLHPKGNNRGNTARRSGPLHPIVRHAASSLSSPDYVCNIIFFTILMSVRQILA
jgi:hypothetical protein